MSKKNKGTDSQAAGNMQAAAHTAAAIEAEARPSRFSGYKNRAWVIITVLLTANYLWWRIRETLPLEYGWVSIVCGVALLVVEFLGAIEALVHYYNMHRIENHPLPVVPQHLFPDVDVFIATYNESEELLYKTINGCKYMDYPDKAKVHIYLCDDGRRAEMRELALRCGIHYLDREDNEGAKAGNLNHALSCSSSPLIVTLDADMIPKHDFLMNTVPYFVDAEMKNEGKEEKDWTKIGFVQSPQSFYNPDLFQFNLFSENRIPNEQDYFYLDVQVSRNRSNSVIYGGSNTMLSRAAIEEIGGFYTKAITEDFATGILMQKKGYTCYAINQVLASGMSATDLKSLIAQRTRWARGCISTGRKMHILLSPKLSIPQKANYWASVWYWYAPLKRLIYYMSPIMFAVFGFVVLKCTLPQVLLYWLPMYISSNITLRMLSRNIRTTKWTSIYETVLFPFMLFPVIAEFFGITLKKFSVTKKDNVAKNSTGGFGERILPTLPFLLLIVLSVIGIVNCVRLMLMSGSVSASVVLFWLLVNLFFLSMAVFFLLGRRMYRGCERVQAEVDCVLTTVNEEIACVTKDFSETGLALWLEAPYDIDENETVNIKLTTERYQAELKAKTVFVDQAGSRWKYSFIITDHCDSYDEYLQILYDRVPTMPSNLENAKNSLDDVRVNIDKRVRQAPIQNRRYPRVPINKTMEDSQGHSLRLLNFNYKYVLVDGQYQNDVFELPIDEDLSLKCIYERNSYNNNRLYAIANYEDFHNNAYRRRYLRHWLQQIVQRQVSTGSAQPEISQSDVLVSDILAE